MLGTKRLFSSVLSKALASILAVDEETIETSLLSKDGRVVLQTVKLKERRIPVSSKEGITTYMVLTGTFDEIVLLWKWSNSTSLVEDTALLIRGVRIGTSFFYSNDPENSPKGEEEIAKSDSFFGWFGEELQNMKRIAIGNIKHSAMIQQTISDILDSFSIKIFDLEYRMQVPAEKIASTLPTSNIVGGFTSIELVSLGSVATPPNQRSQIDMAIDFMKRPLMVQANINSLYVNLVDRGINPIIEPFTYTATIRRVAGLRFLTMLSGYEIIGREGQSMEQAIRNDDNHGLVLHYSPQVIEPFRKIAFAFSGPSHKNYDADLYNADQKTSSYEATPNAIMLFLAFIYLLALLPSLALLTPLIRRILPIAEQTNNMWIWMSGTCLYVGVSISMIWRHQAQTDNEVPLFVEMQSKSEAKVANRDPAVFRLPLPYVSVVAPKGVRITLSKVSILGRIDGSVINLAASGFEVVGTSSEIAPKISMSSIRASYRLQTLIANIDFIEEAFIPGTLRLIKPVKFSVFRFEKGTVKVKLNYVEAEVLSSSSAENTRAGSNLEIEKMARRVHTNLKKTGKKLNAEIHKGVEKLRHSSKMEDGIDPREKEAKLRLNAELYGEVLKLKIIAMMFEKIPLQNNRLQLRLYRHTFRGIDAVNYLLENRIADSRLEAIKIARDVQIEFNLFENVTREFKFRDGPDCLYRFVDVKRRRYWEAADLPYSHEEVDDSVETKPPPLPFPIAFTMKNLVLKKGGDDGPLLEMKDGELYLEPAKIARAIDGTMFAGEVEARMISLTNPRIRVMIDPDMPKLVHRFQFSVDSLRANPEYSAEDWYDKLGFSGIADETSGADDAPQAVRGPISLPFAYIAAFKLHLSWKGVIIATKESVMNAHPFIGTEETTSNDLISYFVMHILGRAPGMLAGVRFMGINVVESTGFATAMNVGAKFIPFGQYIGVAALAAYDGMTGGLDAGKTARGDPNGSYKAGDFMRGVLFSAEEAARAGAERRGKTHEEFYDEDDNIQVDPLDFALGTASGMATYVYHNKARFAGATIAGATMVAATVATGPIGGIVVGVIAGAGAEWIINKTEDRIKGKGSDNDADNDGNTLASF